MEVFCTIITASHIAYAKALYYSLAEHGKKPILYTLVVDKDVSMSDFGEQDIIPVPLKEMYTPTGKKIIHKYSDQPTTILRWALKPILLDLLLRKHQKAIFLDPDLCFFNDYSFLFEALSQSNMLLTPHWRSINPDVNQSQFLLTFKEGIYNAGFVGASVGAEPALSWWASACLEKCDTLSPGIYVDQAYLNVLPIYFEKITTLKHQGCNTAAWNKKICKREKNESGETVINKTYYVIFIHFTNSTIKGIVKGRDKYLASHLEKYKNHLKKAGLDKTKEMTPGMLSKINQLFY